jgi:clan AA aspartic protease (TIGR02281 family)
MKAAVLAACAALAFGEAQPALAIELQCPAPLITIGPSDNDANPVVSVHVIAPEFIGGAWHVTYELADGQTIKREDQYEVVDASTPQTPQEDWRWIKEWSGNNYLHPNMHMHGQVLGRNSVTGLHYREIITDHNKRDDVVLDMTAYDCRRLTEAPALVAAPAPPAPQPQIAQPDRPQVVQPSGGDSVPIYLDNGGRSVWVDVQLGSLTQRMLIDTGATNISIQKSVANNLLRRGEASLEDPGQFTIADGSTHAESVIRIDTVRLGNRVLHDVIAGVLPEQASPLLGFPVLNQAGRFTIDTKNRQLIFDQDYSHDACRPHLSEERSGDSRTAGTARATHGPSGGRAGRTYTCPTR